ncbi:sirohydrochlorin chelatase [Streptomyces halobius]|uniref:Sirohydrochlorin chelatase n=1 Tax=Streptomyces halobius TaxID=2879846 RepID=A0ABY4MEF2_9ACTN|nr:sirohydrochlorin chelatase [Streptomyces halobius]UQA96159.1 sirohydrochlorin chelatase [Streptomyces halobius]
MTTPPALLIAGHGTRDEGGAEALRALVHTVGERHPDVPVTGGFFGLAPSGPPLAEAVAGLVERGVTRVAAVPLLLAPTGAVRDALPEALERAREHHPDLGWACAAELEPGPRLLDTLERRVEAALGSGARRPEDRARTTVLLVGRGASEPQANAEVARAARLLWEGRGFAGVETAFVSQAWPDVPAGLDRCAALATAAPGAPGAVGPRRIVVLPYFLFSGDLLERLCMQTEGWAAAHPGIEVYGAEMIGPGAELAEVVVERYLEMVAGVPLLTGAAYGDRAAEGDTRGTDGAPGRSGAWAPGGEGHGEHADAR